MLTERQQDTYDFIVQYIEQYDRSPYYHRGRTRYRLIITGLDT